MSAQLNQIQKPDEGCKWRPFVPWLWFALALVWFLVFVWLDHSRGKSWAAAFGYPMNARFLAEFAGGFVVPLVLTMVMLRFAKRLSPSSEKTALLRIGWSLYFFLFAWELVRQLVLRQF